MPALPLYSRTPVSCWSTSKRPGWPNWPAETAPRRIVEQGNRALPAAESTLTGARLPPAIVRRPGPHTNRVLLRAELDSARTSSDSGGRPGSSLFSQSAHGYHSLCDAHGTARHRFHRTTPSSWFDDHLRFYS